MIEVEGKTHIWDSTQSAFWAERRLAICFLSLAFGPLKETPSAWPISITSSTLMRYASFKNLTGWRWDCGPKDLRRVSSDFWISFFFFNFFSFLLAWAILIGRGIKSSNSGGKGGPKLDEKDFEGESCLRGALNLLLRWIWDKVWLGSGLELGGILDFFLFYWANLVLIDGFRWRQGVGQLER